MTTHHAQQLPSLSNCFIWGLLVLLMVIGAYLRVHGATEYYYNPDETLHLDIARGLSLADIFRRSLYETHPPLFYGLLHYWLMLSDNPVIVRSLSLLCGLALIPIYYRIGSVVGGTTTGLCTAFLAAFSPGLIVQSYLVREYAVFVLFLSCSFYYYVRWRDSPTYLNFLVYFCFTFLACSTHFAGIFYVACITAAETLSSPAKKKRLIAGNLLLITATFLAGLYYFEKLIGHPFFAPPSTAAHYFINPKLLLPALLYPACVFIYMLPCQTAALASFLLAPLAVLERSKVFRHLCILSCLAFLLGMALLATNKYPFTGDRHALWMVPFLLTGCGYALAILFRWMAHLPTKDLPYPQLLAIALLALGWITYDPALRFSDMAEYCLKNQEWADIKNYLNSLTSHDLVLSEADSLLSDTKIVTPQYFVNDEKEMPLAYPVTVVPLFNSHHLFWKRSFDFSANSLLFKLEEVQAHGFLKNADTLIFLYVGGTKSAIMHLMLCPSLPKKIVAFPPLPSDKPIDERTIIYHPVTLLVVSKAALLEQAPACLAGKKDLW